MLFFFHVHVDSYNLLVVIYKIKLIINKNNVQSKEAKPVRFSPRSGRYILISVNEVLDWQHFFLLKRNKLSFPYDESLRLYFREMVMTKRIHLVCGRRLSKPTYLVNITDKILLALKFELTQKYSASRSQRY